MAFDLGGGKGSIRPAMNVTPLVDVVLVLLIIFMVVTPLMTKQMWMTVPAKGDDQEAPPPPPDAKPPVVLTVDKSGVLRINREEVPRDQVVARLQRMLNARPDKIVFFDASDDVPYGAAMDVLDLARGGDITVGVLPDKLAD
ncbi:tonB system transport protein, ExbD/TolR family [Myxococcus xanthus DK 1622]|uniref:TonB system transport protein, ExbD/TolR family n=2 Tax=Myxococcus TaxID=32 RepID=Q1DFL9_MYXXD|nr:MULTISPECIES: biopolymer transporter ExbD [Myxococcus]ABF89022.1 tonB system transport protein, ExbD/TolR family [Myxococcus xanthus DK 1622]NOJ56130.1 biopolymer transporter ExbD [Myxococcus xanthus]QPM79997.1 biopolymer transporter ExbD [Myxococcus xanthus]QVW69061.1 biopolymer transporter ExbD [Myxococcus xanthus DZ2]QZZ47833.1 Biopolymer transport protein ExbD [Myxococcus xanthus]